MPTSTTQPSTRLPFIAIPLIAVSLAITGCEKTESIQTYTVPTYESLQTPEFLKKTSTQKPREERMLAAIVAKEPALWFFKLQGPPEAITAQESVFREFLKTIQLPSPERIDWKLPADWTQKNGSGMRYATLVLPTQPTLEISVTTFPIQGGSLTDNLVNNINRWRGQLDLPFITAEDLPTRTETIQAGDLSVIYVNLLGKAKPQAAMPMMPERKPETSKPSKKSQDDPADVKYDKPEGWAVAPLAPMAMATFEVKDGNRAVLISVSRAGGSLADNVNRWRTQVGLSPLPEGDVSKSLTKVPVGDRTGDFVELKGQDPRTGQDKAILGVIAADGYQSLFIKLTGDPELAVRERSRFEEFAKSVR